MPSQLLMERKSRENTTGVAGVAGVVGKRPPRKYCDEDIKTLLSNGYIQIHPQLWDHIPIGAHVRYVKKDVGDNLDRCDRFKPGGFVRNHYTSKKGESIITIENMPGGSKYQKSNSEYISFPLDYNNIEELWKKYDKDSFIEIHLINNSLSRKNKQIEELNNSVAELTQRIKTLEDILRSAIKK